MCEGNLRFLLAFCHNFYGFKSKDRFMTTNYLRKSRTQNFPFDGQHMAFNSNFVRAILDRKMLANSENPDENQKVSIKSRRTLDLRLSNKFFVVEQKVHETSRNIFILHLLPIQANERTCNEI